MRLVSARQAISWAYDAQLGVSWEMTGAMPSKADNCGRIWNGLEKGRVIVATETLPVAARAWALWCYTDEAGSAHEAAILDWLCDQIDQAPPVRLDGMGRLRRLLVVMHMLMLDACHRERCGRHRYNSADLARAAGVDRAQFGPTRTWGAFRRCVEAHLERLIAESLAPVRAMIDRANDDHDLAA